MRHPKKMHDHLMRPRNCGILHPNEGEMLLVTSALTRKEENIEIKLYVLIDREDGCVADAKFQAIAQSFLLAALDILCDLIVQKNYEQIRRYDLPFLLTHFETVIEYKEFHLLPHLLEEVGLKCSELKLPKVKTTPVPVKTSEGELPNWESLTHEERLSLIESVIAEEVRPYIEMDEGGIDVVALQDKEVVIAYKGACTTCFSSIGSTLASIESILQTKVMRELTVKPDNITL